MRVPLERGAIAGFQLANRLAARAANACRPDALFVARTTPDGGLVPVGSAELGLKGEEREQLRRALEQRRTAARRSAHRSGPGVWVDADVHGRERAPLHDAVMRRFTLDQPPA